MKGTAENTNKLLMDAALRVFTEKGFAGASTREIVEICGVTKPTLYYHFGSKDNLYRSILEEIFERFNREIARIAAEELPPRTKLLNVIRFYLDHYRESPREVKLILMALYRSDPSLPDIDIGTGGRPIVESIAVIIRDGGEAGVFKESNPLQLSLQLIGMIHIQILLILNDRGNLPLSRPEDILATFLGGIERR
jgi:AcrR family transcriptional regulator